MTVLHAIRVSRIHTIYITRRFFLVSLLQELQSSSASAMIYRLTEQRYTSRKAAYEAICTQTFPMIAFLLHSWHGGLLLIHCSELDISEYIEPYSDLNIFEYIEPYSELDISEYIEPYSELDISTSRHHRVHRALQRARHLDISEYIEPYNELDISTPPSTSSPTASSTFSTP
eukprot:1192246-Prorocentrum_minimum.AAC.2